ncbi:unnamed protein product [Ceratitis capitata]|uniref:(Mediterranean fruit fly) hypothetical protein n=1 Tax=Ceratitis capitata TaxID=7213 RepID=A0A811V890_CERCA|nr:unnamed protein product [Ceratitis capitata]
MSVSFAANIKANPTAQDRGGDKSEASAPVRPAADSNRTVAKQQARQSNINAARSGSGWQWDKT